MGRLSFIIKGVRVGYKSLSFQLCSGRWRGPADVCVLTASHPCAALLFSHRSRTPAASSQQDGSSTGSELDSEGDPGLLTGLGAGRDIWTELDQLAHDIDTSGVPLHTQLFWRLLHGLLLVSTQCLDLEVGEEDIRQSQYTL